VIALEDAALAYAARGWPVIPLAWPIATGETPRCSCREEVCRRIGKHPHGLLVKYGLSEATCDAKRVRQWWAQVPQANIGIVLGEPAGMWALDVDPSHAGDRTLVDLVRDHGPIGDTLRAATGSGGDHYFFAHPGLPVRNRGIGLGLDVRGDAGYVVALPAPEWLVALLFPEPAPEPERVASPSPRPSSARRPDARERAIAYLATLPAAIQGQRGSDACFKAAVHLVRGFGLSEREALALLEEHYNPRCQPPWSPRELAHKVQSASRSQLPHGYLLDVS